VINPCKRKKHFQGEHNAEEMVGRGEKYLECVVADMEGERRGIPGEVASTN
jgi:hypothetical protein